MFKQLELKVTVLIVIYNKRLDQCSTFLSLLDNVGAAQLNVVVWDNSDAISLQNNAAIGQQYCNAFASLSVMGEGVNLSLSVVYNTQFKHAFEQEQADFVILLDHDTELPADYVQTLKAEYLKSAGEVLLVPQVRSKAQMLLVSPRRQEPYYFLSRYQLSCDFEGLSYGLHKSQKLFAVASGLAIPASVWQSGIRFEQRLCFYGIDTEFCVDYAKQFSHFWLSAAQLVHDISEEAVELPAVKMWRFEQHMDYWRFQLQKHAPYPAWFSVAFVECYRRVYRLKVRLKQHA